MPPRQIIDRDSMKFFLCPVGVISLSIKQNVYIIYTELDLKLLPSLILPVVNQVTAFLTNYRM